MDRTDDRPVRIGILWRGDRTSESPLPPPDRHLAPLFEAFKEFPVEVVPIPFADDAIDEVRDELLDCDGVLVWVNPLQDGDDRAQLDNLLRDASTHGVYVSADPDVILRIGTKKVLVETRDLGWGSDASVYESSADLKTRFPARFAQHGRIVLKQGRGNGGNGVWKVDLVEKTNADAGPDTVVRVRDAQSRDGSSETVRLGDFLERCEEYFAWSGCLVDQEFQERLADGMLRCYFTHDEVVGFARQWPQGLLESDSEATAQPTRPSVMEGPDVPAYQSLRVKAEQEWVPQMMTILGLEREVLPVIWDADFLFGPKDATGHDTYVLCEVNVSAVWPFPPMASTKVAAAAWARSVAARTSRA
ncbi:MAG TPA: Cj0069 family protein [Acidimicrobiales bacterium]|nr:Cj0069 family protein [Acidimicrobiales bacterium]